MALGMKGAGSLPALMLAVLLAAGCASTPLQGAAGPPAWMKRLPDEHGGVFYQVGASAKTFHQKDAIDRAYDDGVEKLAKRLKVDVESVLLEVEGDRGGELRHRSISTSSEVAEVAIYGAEQAESYYDRDGLFGPPETTYVLVRWSEGMMKQQMERLLKEKKK